ncbi:MAG: MFS transporter [Bacteroidetes bacterium]|jgi:FHS family L-fucose permease-like MFS transporter|nr:MFS transporter [Bacteroidota bacterium]NBX64172.1 MFS transporter [Bacteroidota bacterium]
MRYIYALFFLWAIAHNLNPLLIPVLKEVCILSDFQSALVDSAFYIGYFAFALPAGAFIKSKGYKKAITLGLYFFGVGAAIVGIFGSQQNYAMALLGLFVMAAGLTFLETAANPLVTLLGDPQKATTRLNLAQSFNGLGATLAVFFGGMALFAGSEEELAHFIETTGKTASSAEWLAFRGEQLFMPYVVVAMITIGFSRLLRRPKIQIDPESTNPISGSPNFVNPSEPYLQPGTSAWQQIKTLLQTTPYNLGILAQFCYVGAQVGVGSFFIRYATTYGNVSSSVGATGLSLGMLLFMLGRFTGTFLMRWIAPTKLLLGTALIAAAISTTVALNGGPTGFWLLIPLQFFMSILFPTIFSLSLSSLKNAPPMASSLLIMSIVGGAFFPLVMGAISDQFGLQYAYLVPVLCFAVVTYFAKRISPTLA